MSLTIVEYAIMFGVMKTRVMSASGRRKGGIGTQERFPASRNPRDEDAVLQERKVIVVSDNRKHRGQWQKEVGYKW